MIWQLFWAPCNHLPCGFMKRKPGCKNACPAANLLPARENLYQVPLLNGILVAHFRMIPALQIGLNGLVKTCGNR